MKRYFIFLIVLICEVPSLRASSSCIREMEAIAAVKEFDINNPTGSGAAILSNVLSLSSLEVDLLHEFIQRRRTYRAGGFRLFSEMNGTQLPERYNLSILRDFLDAHPDGQLLIDKLSRFLKEISEFLIKYLTPSDVVLNMHLDLFTDYTIDVEEMHTHLGLPYWFTVTTAFPTSRNMDKLVGTIYLAGENIQAPNGGSLIMTDWQRGQYFRKKFEQIPKSAMPTPHLSGRNKRVVIRIIAEQPN